jgi:carboxyl-terminal processing protease
MKLIKTIAFIFLFINVNAQSTHSDQDSLKTTLTQVFQKVKQYSVYRHQVNWEELEEKILNKSDTNLNFEEFKQRIRLLFLSIGDRHAALYLKGIKISATDNPISSIRSSLISQLQNTDIKLHTRTLEDELGYILIPSNTSRDNIPKMAQAIQDSLCKLLNNSPKGVIVDLRVMEGGSIYPLFSGLHQLIGEGSFGAFTNFAGTSRTEWILKKGKFYQQRKIVASVKPGCICPKNIKVAVLLSQLTASAGEMLAIAFKGRKNTVFIGEETFGLTTGNVTFPIDNHLLALSASYSQDRTGNIYNRGVKPDMEWVEGDDFSNISNDKKVDAAIRWMKENN